MGKHSSEQPPAAHRLDTLSPGRHREVEPMTESHAGHDFANAVERGKDYIASRRTK